MVTIMKIYYSENKGELLVLDEESLYTTNVDMPKDSAQVEVTLNDPEFYTGDVDEIDWDTNRNGDNTVWGNIDGREVLYTESDEVAFLESRIYEVKVYEGSDTPQYAYFPEEVGNQGGIILGLVSDDDFQEAKKMIEG
jgi:hypothetical protein